MPSRLVVALLLFGCGGEPPAPPETARLVEVAPITRQTAVDRLSLLGDVHGEFEVRVFPDFAERVRAVHVVEGAQVAAGDPLVTLEAALPSSDVAQADAALMAAEASRDRIRADLARVRPLVLADALPRSQLESLEASLRAAEAQVAQLSAGRRAANVRRSRTVIRAPRDGIVAGFSVNEGDSVAPTMPVGSVVRLERVKIKIRVVEADYVQLHEGMEVQVKPVAIDGETRTGQLTSLSPVLDRVTRTGNVEILVDNEDHMLRPGMVAEVGIELRRREGILMAPSRAVLMTTATNEDRRASVFVRDGDRARRREVVLGRRYPAPDGGETQVEIVDGLTLGEEIVVQGQHLLRDGALIRIQSQAAEVAQR